MAKNQANQTTPKTVETPQFSSFKEDKSADLPFSKANYRILLVGLAFLIVGFIIMTLDKEEFGFGFLGLTLGPIITFLGFLIPFYALFKKK